jgi:hypothetical protein
MDIITCLLNYPRRTLMALAAVYGLTAHYRRPKDQVAQELGAAICDRLPQTVAALDADARAALRRLIGTSDLALPRPVFVARFGSLHPYRPWNQDPHVPPAPWPTPPSPAATIVHYGLAYPLNLGTRQRPLHSIVLPHDLRDALAVLLDLPIALPSTTAPPPSHPHAAFDVSADLSALLSFLNHENMRVRHGRWLPPRALKLFNERLSPPDDLGAGRSELQAARISFIHYLAERAGLVGLIGDYLKPTLVAEKWLTAARQQRLCVLWDTWCESSDDNRALWHRYRLPALEEDDGPSTMLRYGPVARFRVLLDSLAACPVGPLGQVSDLLNALVERDPDLLRPQTTYATWVTLDPHERAAFETRARTVLLDLLGNHLVWFGLLGRVGELANGRAVESATFSLHLTPLGAALLGRDDGVWPADPAPTPLHVAPLLARDEPTDPAVLIRARDGVPLSDRFTLEAIVPPAPAAVVQNAGEMSQVERVERYALTRLHFLHALQRGHTVEGVVNFLERASGEPLSAPVLGTLYRWEEDLDRVSIRQTLLLQARDPTLLRDLTAQRRVRETLGQTLNARTVEVRADRLDALLRRLAWRGIIPRLDLPRPLHPQHGPSPSSERTPLPGRERELEDEHAAIVVALRVYAHLADELGLATRPAYALSRRWSEGLPLRLHDGIERTVERTLEALHRAAPLEMEDRLPEPTGPLLKALETAIQERATVEIEYYTAGRAHRTTRRVDPLRLEWRGDVAYLIAYCHLRRDERVFRVDRIARTANCE